MSIRASAASARLQKSILIFYKTLLLIYRLNICDDSDVVMRKIVINYKQCNQKIKKNKSVSTFSYCRYNTMMLFI